ncbi:MAG: hypothetical protein WKF79_06200 [Nocardioides sp.]
MSTRATSSTHLTFTSSGEAVLDDLAAALTASRPESPEAIAAILAQVLHTHIDDLAAAVTAADPDRATGLSLGLSPSPPPNQGPDEVARRRLGTPQQTPAPYAPWPRAARGR